MEKTPLDRSLLLDFYGDLLTEKQREYCDLHWNEDYSLGEIARLGGSSRQGVWDILRRAETTLAETEEKLGLVRRYLERRAALRDIRERLAAILPDNADSRDLLRRLEELE